MKCVARGWWQYKCYHAFNINDIRHVYFGRLSFENSRKINKVNLKKRCIQPLPRQEPGPFELKKTKNFGHKITFISSLLAIMTGQSPS